MWITNYCGIFLKRQEYQVTLPAFWDSCMQVRATVRIRHVTTDWFKIGKGVHQGCILSCCLLNLYAKYIMWNARLDEAQAGINTAKININSLRHANDNHSNVRKWKETKEPLDESERGDWKSWLKTQYSKNLRSWHPILSLHGK